MTEVICKAAEEMPKISVIIPVYNTELYVGRCLDSILNSTYRNLEVLCIDDGSKDNSLSILQQYEKKDKRVCVIAKSNNGVSFARNKGMEAASGEYISFVDSDDWVHPTMFEVLAEAMQDDVIMAVCGEKRVTDFSIDHTAKQEPPILYPNLIRAYSNIAVRYYLLARLYRASAVKNNRFDETCRLGEDTLFNLQLSDLNGKCVFIPARLYYYFQRTDSAVHSAQWQDHLGMVEAFLSSARIASGAQVQAMLYEDAIKKAFSFRYEYLFTREHRVIKAASKKQVRCALKEWKQNQGMSRKKRFIYILMNEIPNLYRFYRIITDPTMLQWEKKRKKVLLSDK